MSFCVMLPFFSGKPHSNNTLTFFIGLRKMEAGVDIPHYLLSIVEFEHSFLINPCHPANWKMKKLWNRKIKCKRWSNHIVSFYAHEEMLFYISSRIKRKRQKWVHLVNFFNAKWIQKTHSYIKFTLFIGYDKKLRDDCTFWCMILWRIDFHLM